MENNNQNKICQNCKKDFIIESEDFKFYEKISVPTPTFCPECRLARKLAWRNERTLYKRICDLCKENIISMHKPESTFPVYCHNCWWSDKWSPLDYGINYNFLKPFFIQFNELQNKVPRPANYGTANIKSDYCNHTAHMKNCYLTFGAWFCENSHYCQSLMESKDCIDCVFTRKSEFCISSNDLNNCNNILFSRKCNNCIDSIFIYDCKNCQNCILSYNLRNKNYYILNKPVSKEKFEKFKKEILYSRESLEKAKKDFETLIKEKAIHKFMTGERNQNISGDLISNSKNVHKSYFIDNGENEKYAIRGGVGQKDTMDAFGTHGGELCYETNNIDFCHKCLFSINGEHNINTNYLIDCDHLENSFGCISIRKNEYCILNKKYSKEEYEKLLQKIIKNMNENPYIDDRKVSFGYGEFFPGEFSPFAYNDTIAQEYFPLTKEETKKLGYKWNENQKDKNYTQTISWKDLPQTMQEVDNSILNQIILCEEWEKDEEKAKNHNCTKAFRIIEDELIIYKKYGIPLPTKCPNSRYFELQSKRNGINFYHRKCMKENCNNEFETSYSPDRPEIVYCESCYNKEIY